jgi:hypothetical protein
MHEGLLWFDADPKRALNEKIAQAADRYRHKFGRKPNLCYINPVMLPGSQPAECNGVRLVLSRSVLKHHFWIGIEETAELSQQAVQ